MLVNWCRHFFCCKNKKGGIFTRYRNIKKQFWFNEEECKILAINSTRAGLSESEYMREILVGYKLKEKPDNRFYDNLKILRNLANNMNQIAKKANSLGFIDELSYKRNAEMIKLFIKDFKNEYLKETIKEGKE